MSSYSQHVTIPDGQHITFEDQGMVVPDQPIIPVIEGDGVGVDITPQMKRVVDAAVAKAYDGKRQIAWMAIYAGQQAYDLYADDQWLPQETLSAISQFKVAIKGPLTTPVGGGIRSLNVALRQKLDLYVCMRPVRYFKGSPSPLKEPWKTDMVIFRENSEGIYAGIEWEPDSPEAKTLLQMFRDDYGMTQIRFPNNCGVGVKITSEKASKRLIQKAFEHAIDRGRDKVTLVHKGNIMKFTEGAFCQWGYDLARDLYGAKPLDGGPWLTFDNPKTGKPIIVNDVICDAFLQQILLRPEDFDVIATMNLNGDYISDALAAHVGGIGMAPGVNMGEDVALFEATHGTAPTHAGKDKVNPSSLILSAVMMLEYMGWQEAADLIISGIEKSISDKIVTYDLARLDASSTQVSCSGFADNIIACMA